jgi:hypothetical protein
LIKSFVVVIRFWSSGAHVFLALDGASSGGVRIEAGDLADAKQPFTLGQDVPAGALTLK